MPQNAFVLPLLLGLLLVCLLHSATSVLAKYPSSPCEHEWCLVATGDGGAARATEVRIPSATLETYAQARARCAALGASIASFSVELADEILPRRQLPASAAAAWSNVFFNETNFELQSTRWVNGAQWYLPLLNTSRWGALSGRFDTTGSGVNAGGGAAGGDGDGDVSVTVFYAPKAGMSAPGCFVFNASQRWDLSLFWPDCSATNSKAVAVCERPTSVAWTPLNDTPLEVGIASFVATAADAKAQCERWGGTLAAVPSGAPANGAYSGTSYLDFIAAAHLAQRPSTTSGGALTADTDDLWLGYDARTAKWAVPATAGAGIVTLLGPASSLPSTPFADSCTFLNTTLRTIHTSDCGTTRRTVACTRYSRPRMRNATSLWCRPSAAAASRAYMLYPPATGGGSSAAAAERALLMPNATQLHTACTSLWGGATVTIFDHVDEIAWCYAAQGSANSSVVALLSDYNPATGKDTAGGTVPTASLPAMLKNLTAFEDRALVANLSTGVAFNASSGGPYFLPGLCVADLANGAAMRFVPAPFSPSNWTAVPGGVINVTMLMGRPFTTPGESFTLCFTGSSPLLTVVTSGGGGPTCQTFSDSANAAAPVAEARSWMIQIDYAAGSALTEVTVPFQCSPASACGGATFNSKPYAVLMPVTPQPRFKFYRSADAAAELSADELTQQREQATAGFPLFFDIVTTAGAVAYSANTDGYNGADYDALVFTVSGTAGGADSSCNVYPPAYTSSSAGGAAAVQFDSLPANTPANAAWYRGAAVTGRFMLLCNRTTSTAGTVTISVACDRRALLHSTAVSRMTCRSFPNATTVIEFTKGVAPPSGANGASLLRWNVSHVTFGDPVAEAGVSEGRVLKYYPFAKPNALRVKLDYPNISGEPQFACVRLIVAGSPTTWKHTVTCIAFVNSTSSVLAEARRLAWIAASNTTTTTAAPTTSSTTSSTTTTVTSTSTTMTTTVASATSTTGGTTAPSTTITSTTTTTTTALPATTGATTPVPTGSAIFVPHPTRQFEIPFDPQLDFDDTGNVSVTVELFGSVADQYAATTLTLRLTPYQCKVTLSGLSDVIIYDPATPYALFTITASNEYDVPCAPLSGCGRCDNRVRDQASLFFAGNPMKIESFARNGSTSMWLFFTNPQPAGADWVRQRFQPEFQCTNGESPFFVFVYAFNQTVELRKPRALNVSGAPDTLYVGGPARTFYVHTPNPFVAYGNVTAPLVNLSITTSSSALRITPNRIEWNTSSDRLAVEVSGIVQGAAQRIDFMLLSPSTPQFTAPPSIFVQVLPRATVDLRLNNPQTAYVVGVEYLVAVVISRLPLDPDEVLTVSLVQNSTYFVASALHFYANSSSTAGDLTFRFVALPSLSTSVTAAEYGWLNVSLTGSAADAYFMPEGLVTSSIRLGPIRPRVAIVVQSPAFALAGSTFDVFASLSRPPVTSISVHLTVTTASAALTLQPASPVVLTWYAGESQAKKFNVTSSAAFEGDTVLNFSTSCEGCLFKEVDDNITTAPGAAVAMLPENGNAIKIAITARSTAELLLYGPVDLILDRVTCFNVSLSKPPPASGVLNVALAGNGLAFASVKPPVLSLAGSTFTTRGTFCVNGTQVTPPGQRVNLTLSLLGAAADLFEPIVAHSTIQLQVNPRLNLVLDLPTELIVKTINRRNSSFALPEPLAPNVVFSLYLWAPGVVFEPSNFVIFGHEPDTNATRYFMMYTTTSDVNVTVRGEIYGNATGFAPVAQRLELLPLGTVSVTADDKPVFRDEIAFLLIRLGRAPLEAATLQATVTTNCSDPATLPWCVMSQRTVSFSRSRPTTIAIVIHLSPAYDDIPADTRVPFVVVFNTSSSAAPQYNLVSQYPTAVHFVPRRKIIVVQAVSTVFLGFPQTLTLNVTALPDAGTTLYLQTSVSANDAGNGAGNTSTAAAASERVEWNSTSGCCDSRLRVLPITVRQRPDNGTLQVSFVLSSVPAVQQLRFAAPEPVTIRVVEKVSVRLVSPPNPTQILGPANNQSFVVALNRPPSGWLRASFVFDAVFIGMIRFVPPVLLWNESDTAQTLNRTCTVIGEFLGVAEAIGFRLEASAIDEVVLAPPASLNLTAPLIASLTVSGLRRVSYAGSATNLVAGLGQIKLILVTVSETPVKYPLVVHVNYTGAPGSLRCNASVVAFVPLSASPQAAAALGGNVVHSGIDGGRTQVIACEGMSPSNQAEFNVTVIDGPEYSKQVDGFVSFAILQRPLLVVRKPGDALAQPREFLTVPSETNLTFALEIQSFEGALKPSVDVSVDLQRNQAELFEFATVRPSGALTFTGASLRQFVSVAVVLRRLQNFTATLVIQFQHDRSQRFEVTLFVVESVRVVVPDFPTTIVAGPWNGVEFHVNQTIVPSDDRVVELRFDTSACSATDVAVASEALRWSKQLSSPIAVGAVGVKPGRGCRLALRSTKSLAPAEQAPVYFEGAFTVLPQPGVRVGTNNTRMGEEATARALQVPFRGVQKDGWTLELHATDGQFKFMAVTEAQKAQQQAAASKVTDAAGKPVADAAANVVVVNASDHFMPYRFLARSAADKDKPLPSSLDMGAVPLYIIAGRTAAEAPRGIAALQATQCPDLIRVVPTAATPNINLPDRNVSNWGATVVITPCTPLLLIEAETLTLVFGARAFDGGFHPDETRRTLKLEVGRVSADLLSASDWIGVQLPAVLGMFIGAFWFPALSLQPVRIASAVLSMDCPVTEVRFLEKQRDLPKVYFLFAESDVQAAPLSENGGWLAVAAVNTALCCLCFLLHFVFAVAGYFRSSGRVKKSFSEVCGHWHFPSASFHVIFFFAGSIVEAAFRVIFLNAKVSLSTGGIVLLLPPLVLVTVVLHGVVWRNHSLEYHDVSHMQANKWVGLRIIGRSGFWTHPDASYIARHSSLFAPFRGAFRWFLLFEYGFTILLSLLSAIEPTGLRGCQARSATMAAVYFILLAAVVAWRPYSIRFHNITFAIYYLIMGACICTIASQMGDRIRDDSIERSAIALAKAAAAVQLVQSVIVLILEAVRWVFGDEESNIAAAKESAALAEAELAIVQAGGGGGGGANGGVRRLYELEDDADLEGDFNRGNRGDDYYGAGDEDDGDPSSAAAAAARRARRPKTKRLTGAAVDDDGEPLRADEVDKGADAALEDYLAGVERSQARGLFLTGALRGGEVAFSPLRKRDLEEHRQLVRNATATLALPKRADPLKEEAAQREAEEKARVERERRAQSSTEAPSLIPPHPAMMTMGRALRGSDVPFDFFRQKKTAKQLRREEREQQNRLNDARGAGPIPRFSSSDDDDDGNDNAADDDAVDDDAYVPGRRMPVCRTKEITPEEFAAM